MMSYLSTINIYNGFNLKTDSAVNGIPIRNYFFKGVPEELLKPFDLQPEMLAFFSDTFEPYPFKVYGAVVVNAETGALETQTLSIFGIDTLGNGQFTEETIAHEISHQMTHFTAMAVQTLYLAMRVMTRFMAVLKPIGFWVGLATTRSMAMVEPIP
jgi:hypothetical protein